MRDASDDREKKNPTLIKRTTHGKKKKRKRNLFVHGVAGGCHGGRLQCGCKRAVRGAAAESWDGRRGRTNCFVFRK